MEEKKEVGTMELEKQKILQMVSETNLKEINDFLNRNTICNSGNKIIISYGGTYVNKE